MNLRRRCKKNRDHPNPNPEIIIRAKRQGLTINRREAITYSGYQRRYEIVLAIFIIYPFYGIEKERRQSKGWKRGSEKERKRWRGKNLEFHTILINATDSVNATRLPLSRLASAVSVLHFRKTSVFRFNVGCAHNT